MISDSTFGTLKALYHTFGCKLNFSETSTVAREFAARGIRRVSLGEQPDIVVVNTCSVTEMADKKCRQTIRSLHRRYPKAAIVVTGCYAQLKPSEVASLDGVAVVAGNDRKGELGALLDCFIAERKPQTAVVPSREINTFTPSCSRGERTRFFLKVQDGCDNWCTYCTIPAARGRSRSATIESLVEQARAAAAEGGREIVLTGVNIGDFGKRSDAPQRETFLDLIRALDSVEGIDRYRISSIEPDLLTDEIIDFCASSRAFMPHFHIPLQSGSDTVLRLMHRHYDTVLFRSRIERIARVMPDAFIGIDLIVGARGETEEEFLRSLEFVRSLPITRLHVFPYSERPGTKALEIDHIVSQQEKHRRTNTMLRFSEERAGEYARRFIGTVRPVLIETVDDKGMATGHTDNYLKVRFTSDGAASNSIVDVELLEISDYDGEDPLISGKII